MQNTLDKINKNLEYCKEEYLKGCVRIGASRNNQLRNNQLRTSSILDGFMYDIKNMNDRIPFENTDSPLGCWVIIIFSLINGKKISFTKTNKKKLYLSVEEYIENIINLLSIF